MSRADDACTHATALVEEALARLGDYVAIPAVSREPERAADVRKMAAVAADDLRAAGLENVEVIEIPGALPCVRADKIVDPSRPTVLIYGHFDQQPSDPTVWATDPQVLTKKGDRLYGRGSADDLGGWLSQLVAYRGWQAAGGAPLNVRFILEGEEEIGSPNLTKFMDAYPDAFAADVMVLTDCDNPATDVAGLTVSLRGLLEMTVRLDALEGKVHSGLWGGALPDPTMGLFKLLGALVDEHGRIPGLDAEPPAGWRASVEGLSPTDDDLRRDAGLLEGVPGLDPGDRPRVEWMWRQAHLTVVGVDLPKQHESANVILPGAEATLSIRLAPGQTGDEVFAHVRELAEAAVPFGLRCTITQGLGVVGWSYPAEGPAFDATGRAYAKAFGKPMVKIGVGGSIPFITLFADRFPDTPLVLNGVMDPRTGAHGPNESMHVGLFEKVVRANVYLLDELAETLAG